MGYPSTYPDGCDNPYNNGNFTLNILYAYTWMYFPSEINTFTYGLPLVLIVGVVGNGAFLFVVFKIKRLHNVTYMYLTNIAVADISLVTAGIGTYLYSYHQSPVRYDVPYESPLGCILSFGIPNVMYYTSIALVTLVTLERYYAICFPLKHITIRSTSRTKLVIAFSWLYSVLPSSIRILKYAKLYRYCFIWPHLDDFKGWPQKVSFCYSLHKNVLVVSDLAEMLPFIVGLVWNGYMYARIIHTLRNREVVKADNQLQVQAAKVSKQVSRMLIVNGSLFFICQIFVRFNTLDDILWATLGVGIWGNESEANGTFLVFGRCMLYANSAINPFVYLLTSSHFRQACKEAFGLPLFGT